MMKMKHLSTTSNAMHFGYGNAMSFLLCSECTACGCHFVGHVVFKYNYGEMKQDETRVANQGEFQRNKKYFQ
jgi:hypothetical protein